MKCIVWILSVNIFLSLTGCTSKYTCQSSVKELIIEEIKSNVNYTNEYKEKEVKHKEELILKFCSELKGQNKLLIIETIANNTYGLIHTYDNQNIFTYEQGAETLAISKGYKYDKYGNLKALFLSLEPDVIKALTQKVEYNKSREKLDDIFPVKVFYIDLTKNYIRYFLLD